MKPETEVKAFGQSLQGRVHRPQLIGGDGSASPTCNAARRRLELRLDQHFHGHQRFQDLLQLIGAPTDQLLGQRRRHQAAVDQGLGPESTDRRVPRDRCVHRRLSGTRIVTLVVPMASVPNQVNEEVLTELLPICEGQARRLKARFRIIGVDMNDRNIEALGQVAGIQSTALLGRRGGETELVVRDEMDRAGSGIPMRGEIS